MLNNGYLYSVLLSLYSENSCNNLIVKHTLPLFQVDSQAVCNVVEQLCSIRTAHVDHFNSFQAGEVEFFPNWINDNREHRITCNEYKR